MTIFEKIRLPSIRTTWDASKKIAICIGQKAKPLFANEIVETASKNSFKEISNQDFARRAAAYLTWNGIGILKRINTVLGSQYSRDDNAKEYIYRLVNSKFEKAKNELRKLLENKFIHQFVKEYLETEPGNQGTVEGLADLIRKHINSNSEREIKAVWRFNYAAVLWCDALSDAELIKFNKKEGVITLPVSKIENNERKDETEVKISENEIGYIDKTKELDEEQVKPELESDDELEQDEVDPVTSVKLNYNIDIKIDPESSKEQLEIIFQHIERLFTLYDLELADSKIQVNLSDSDKVEMDSA